MSRLFSPAVVVIVLGYLLCFGTVLPGHGSEEIEYLPQLTLTVPENESHRDYLGLLAEPGTPFTADQIEADVLLIELFSMYCPFCQEEAPAVNTLYEGMEHASKPGMAIKIIGLGANNSAFEVDHFRTTYNVKFPLFPDPDMAMYNALGGKGTPGFIGAKKSADGRWEIVLRQSGGFYHPDDFLNELLKKSGFN